MATSGREDERRGGGVAGDKLGEISVHVEENFPSVEIMAAAASPIKDGRESRRRSDLLDDSPGRETKVDTSNSRSSAAAAATDSANDGQWHRQRSTVSPEGTLDPSDPQIKQDVLAMMVQYLRSEKLFMSAVVIQDEANMKTTEQQTRRAQGKRLRKAALEGDWHLVVSLITKNLSRRHHKRLLYAAYRQEYLELIERQEFQKAFSFLNRRLKPVEAIAASTPNEFLNLCYLLTCKAVEVEAGSLAPPSEMPPNRLVTLLQQAVAFQIEKGRYHPKVIPQASTLARDYRCPAVPNTPKDTYSGHHTGVKCVTFVGEEAELLASGGADGTIHLWPTNPDRDGGWDWGEGEGIDDGLDSDRSRELAGGRARQRQHHQQRRPCVAALAEDAADVEGVQREATEGQGGSGEGDRDAPMRVGGAREGGGDAGGGDGWGGGGRRTVSPLLSLRCGATCRDETRVWDVASNRAGNLLASASGDGAVRIWTLPPSEQLLSSAGGGRSRDASPGQQQPRAVLRGHGDGPGSSASDVYSVEFHSAQAHVLTAGHDRTVRLYDIESNQEIKVFAGHEAGVLHAIGNSCGNLLVSGGRDSAIIFWDVMSGVCVKTLSQTVGAVTSVDLTVDGMYLLASSRHGPVRTWDVRMGRPLLRYKGHQNTTSSFLRATFGAEEQLVLGGSDDGNLYVWHHRGTQLLHALPGHTGTVYRGTWSANQGLVATCSDDGTVRTWRSRCL